MYAVSDLYKKKIRENTRSYYWSGQIIQSDGTVAEIQAEDMVKGSGTITSQSSDSNQLTIGNVYTTELKLSLFRKAKFEQLNKAMITIAFHLEVSEGVYETVPMGIFDITEVTRTLAVIQITGYDFMLRFDREDSKLPEKGRPYDFLAYCCKACKVELAHTEEEMALWLNGSYEFALHSDHDVETCRDLVYYVAQTLGGFATINREGKLEIRKYNHVPVAELTKKHRYDSLFSEHKNRFTAVRVTNISREISEYYALETDDGLTMSLGSNPLLQYGLDEAREAYIRNILTVITDIDCVPGEVTITGDPAIDLGDAVLFVDAQMSEDCLCNVTSIVYVINGKQKLKCAGRDAVLAEAKSKTDKNIAGLMSKVDAAKVVSSIYTNAREITVGSELETIIDMELVITDAASIQFLANVIAEISADSVMREGTVTVVLDTGEVTGACQVPVDGTGVMRFFYELDGELIEVHQPAGTYPVGSNIITLYYPVELEDVSRVHTWRVLCQMGNGTAVIPRGGIIASAYGQGIGGKTEAEWDGTLSLEDEFTRMGLLHLSSQSMEDVLETVNSHQQVEVVHAYSEQTAKLGLLKASMEEVNTNAVMKTDLKDGFVENTGRLSLLGFGRTIVETIHVEKGEG